MSQRPHSTDTRTGVLYGLCAYGVWGLIPLYFHELKDISSYEILCQRILWSGLLLAVVLTVTGHWHAFAVAMRSRRLRLTLTASAFFLSTNWLLYIYGVISNQTVETSLGYFINPLLNVGLGMLVFRERLRPLQVFAIVLAAAGVINMIVLGGHFPWIALTLGCSFASYGLLRKIAPVDALVGLAVETSVMVVPAIVGLIVLSVAGNLRFGQVGLPTDMLLAASGILTAVPLLWFTKAARLLKLSTLGFMQYLSPTVQFVLAMTVLDERKFMGAAHWASFICIWVALGVYSLDVWTQMRRRATSSVPEVVLEPVPAVSAID